MLEHKNVVLQILFRMCMFDIWYIWDHYYMSYQAVSVLRFCSLSVPC